MMLAVRSQLAVVTFAMGALGCSDAKRGHSVDEGTDGAIQEASFLEAGPAAPDGSLDAFLSDSADTNESSPPKEASLDRDEPPNETCNLLDDDSNGLTDESVLKVVTDAIVAESGQTAAFVQGADPIAIGWGKDAESLAVRFVSLDGSLLTEEDLVLPGIPPADATAFGYDGTRFVVAAGRPGVGIALQYFNASGARPNAGSFCSDAASSNPSLALKPGWQSPLVASRLLVLEHHLDSFNTCLRPADGFVNPALDCDTDEHCAVAAVRPANGGIAQIVLAPVVRLGEEKPTLSWGNLTCSTSEDCPRLSTFVRDRLATVLWVDSSHNLHRTSVSLSGATETIRSDDVVADNLDPTSIRATWDSLRKQWGVYFTRFSDPSRAQFAILGQTGSLAGSIDLGTVGGLGALSTAGASYVLARLDQDHRVRFVRIDCGP